METTYQIIERKLGPKGGHKDKVVDRGMNWADAQSLARHLRSAAPANLDYFATMERGNR